MTTKKEARGKRKTEELLAYKEKVLIIMQDTFASTLTGMVSTLEFLNMVPLLLGFLHAIFHELGERTWQCKADNHDHIFESIDRLWDSITRDREEGNDVISWIDDPEKKAKLIAMQEKAMNMGAAMGTNGGFEESASGHLS